MKLFLILPVLGQLFFSAPDNTEPAAPIPGYELVWCDEFEDNENICDKWEFERLEPGHFNRELQRYVDLEHDGIASAEITDGALHINLFKEGDEVVSARIHSKESWTYGYFEARICLPSGRGTWPAFWMLPDDMSGGWPLCGEIDIMEEVGAVPCETSGSVHCAAYNHIKRNGKTVKRMTAEAESEYHTYAVEWTPDYIKYYVDGVHDDSMLIYVNDGMGDTKTWPFDKDFNLILNVAWGGSWGGFKGIDESALPTCMKIDYVRVYKKR